MFFFWDLAAYQQWLGFFWGGVAIGWQGLSCPWQLFWGHSSYFGGRALEDLTDLRWNCISHLATPKAACPAGPQTN
jgi:hypothetical protein